MYDCVVVGAGAMGSSVAWHLARRGREVAVLDRFEAGHARGSSHGSTRIFRLGYPQADYLELARESLRWWEELEAESGTRLLELTGAVEHGREYIMRPIQGALKASGLPVSRLSPGEAAERWPGLAYEPYVLHQPDAGRILADRTVQVLHRRAVAHGAELRHASPVRRIDVAGDRATVITDDATLIARRVVVAAGSWSQDLLGNVLNLPRMVVTQEQPAHFAPSEAADWPSFLHHGDPGRPSRHMYGAYGLVSPGEGVKVGLHGTGIRCHPDQRTFRPDPRGADILRSYVREWVPGVDPDSAEFISCLYTTTDNEDFVIDRRGPLVVVAGFSGHGFKFTPAIGHLVAGALLDGAALPERFAIDHRLPIERPRRAQLETLLAALGAGPPGIVEPATLHTQLATARKSPTSCGPR
ncbi:FAD-dependent oxidoreductase [Jiangella asiatica]|uniref:FAD-dependent oxidoreductase n=1 Tax=Jiangella asiatica TaxID=2530372 RepID=A0A4R5DJL1_9ACTN|nr:FAD-dependent oxidoreductase [Jiangella asiatica]TDE12180.1 FAD-dependent oxidoreductase [Jiangella asiatica]